MPATAALPVYMDSVPEYEVRGGQMHITMGGMVLVMPVHVFLEGMAKGEAAIAKWHLRELAARQDNVVSLERRAGH